MRLPIEQHRQMPWRIHELTHDFRIEDVWRLPVTGGPDDLAVFVEQFASGSPTAGRSRAYRFLWEARWVLGRLLRWDREGTGIGGRARSLRDRMPADLAAAPPGPALTGTPFQPLYLLDHEFAAEIANRTCHGVLHLGWVPAGADTWEAHLTVLVKPNGLLGRVYLLSIRPLRYTVIYPQLIRGIGARWAAHTSQATA